MAKKRILNKKTLRSLIKESIRELIQEQKQINEARLYCDCQYPGETTRFEKYCYNVKSCAECCTDGKPADPGPMKTAQTPGVKAKPGLREQTTAECQQIYSLADPNSGMNFPGCCETTANWANWDPNQPNDPCKAIRAQAMAINPNFAACCDPNYTGTGTDGDCDDPLWVGMPVPNKTEYCNRCKETGGGVATAGNYPVQLSAGSPYYMNDPNGLNYCRCCDDGHSSGDMDCENPEWVAQNPNAALKCFVCRQATQGCEQLSNIPMTVATAQAAGLTLYSDVATCQANEPCGGDPTGDRCSDPVGSYDVYNQQSDHNEDWGLGCWFCHPEHGGPGQGCQTVNVPMDQQWAYQGYIAGTTSLYTTNALCMADPITKCSDEDPQDKIYCECCDGNSPGNAISMAQTVGSAADCIGAENTVYAGLGVYGCNVSPVSGGPGTNCKKPGTGTPTNPNVYSKVKPGLEKPDRRLREASNYINKILKQ